MRQALSRSPLSLHQKTHPRCYIRSESAYCNSLLRFGKGSGHVTLGIRPKLVDTKESWYRFAGQSRFRATCIQCMSQAVNKARLGDLWMTLLEVGKVGKGTTQAC